MTDWDLLQKLKFYALAKQRDRCWTLFTVCMDAIVPSNQFLQPHTCEKFAAIILLKFKIVVYMSLWAFFHYWKSFVFRWPCLYYTFLSLFGCNHMFKSFFEATGKNVWIIVLFFLQNLVFGWKSLFVGSHFAMGPFFYIEIHLHFGGHVFITLF